MIQSYKLKTVNILIKIEEFNNNVLVKQVDYKYDALGRRVQKIVTHSSHNFERKYVYDGQEVLAEYDESDSILGVYTHSSLRTDDVLSVDVRSTKLASQEGSYFYLKDALGSVTDIVNSSGDLIQHYAYSSFGKILKISDTNGIDITANRTVKTSYGFTNREHDAESGMMYYRARYYIPEIGRFIQEDPHAGKLEYPGTLNSKYIYVLNNPLKYRDPKGEFIDPVTLAIVGAIVGGVNAAINTSGSGRNFFEAVLEGALQGAFIGYGLGAIGGISEVTAYVVSVKSIAQAAFIKRGSFIDNLGTFGSRNVGSGLAVAYSAEFIKAGISKYAGVTIPASEGLSFVDYVGWAYDFENVYDTACSDTGTQFAQQVCRQRPNFVNSEF